MDTTTTTVHSVSLKYMRDDGDGLDEVVAWADALCVPAGLLDRDALIDAEQCGALDGENVNADYADRVRPVAALYIGEAAVVRLSAGAMSWQYMRRVS